MALDVRMSFHTDDLASVYNVKIVSQRLKNDFFWKLLQKNSPEFEAWLGGAIKMVLEDVGGAIDEDQREFWERLQDPAAPINVRHIFFLFAVCCYSSLQDALLEQEHHAKGALSTFIKSILPMAFEELYNGEYKMTGADIFVRHVRHEYITAVGFYVESQ